MFWVNLTTAFHALTYNRARTALSATGIMVASVAILLLVSIAKGVQEDVRSQVQDLGVNLLVVIPGQIKDGSAFNPNITGLSYLKEEDVGRVMQIKGVRTAAPIMFYGGGITHGKTDSPSTLILATTPEWFQIHPAPLAEGRLFTNNDLGNKKVCVIGTLARDALFGKGKALGQKVDINGENCEIVGVLEEKTGEESAFSQMSFANIAYVPFGQAKAKAGTVQVHRIMIQTDPEVEPKSMIKAVKSKLLERLDERTFSVLTQEDLLKVVFKIMGILTWLLTGLTGIALFVGGLGIMSIMLMAANERRREIGIRKATGARRVDILTQFLSEAILVSAVGGLAGLLISWLADLALIRLTPIKPDLNASIVALGTLTCLGLGAIFGLLPAWQAANQDPVEALRSE